MNNKFAGPLKILFAIPRFVIDGSSIADAENLRPLSVALAVRKNLIAMFGYEIVGGQYIEPGWVNAQTNSISRHESND
jgi:hypothetical protein